MHFFSFETIILFFTDVLNGYNGTIFAYGQTSSGKTHTMEVSYELKISWFSRKCLQPISHTTLLVNVAS